MDSTPVSAREAQVIEAVTGRGLLVFTPRDIRRFLGITDRNTYRILDNLVEKDLAKRLAHGVYVISETYDERDSYELISQLERASYIGFWSALHFHGLTDQVPRVVFVVVTKQKRPVTVQGQTVRFVRIAPDAFFGYDRYGEAVVSDPEKTVLDCLRQQEYAGGVRHVAEAITDDLDVDRLVRYAERLSSGAVAARVGYLLERKGLLDGADRLQQLVSSYTKLDPGAERANPVDRWKLYANVTLDD